MRFARPDVHSNIRIESLWFWRQASYTYYSRRGQWRYFPSVRRLCQVEGGGCGLARRVDTCFDALISPIHAGKAWISLLRDFSSGGLALCARLGRVRNVRHCFRRWGLRWAVVDGPVGGGCEGFERDYGVAVIGVRSLIGGR